MSRRESAPADSLDMLLDTLCNTFGGLVFIAMMLVLMSSSSTNAEADGRQQAQDELVERQIARADERINELIKQTSAISTKEVATTTDSESSKVRLLEETLARLLKETGDLQQTIETSANQLVAAGNTDFAQQTREINQARKELQREQSVLNAAREYLARLNERIREFEKELADAKSTRIERYRLPKENELISKRPIYVFVRYGKIFPINFYQNGDLTRNENTISWRDESDRSVPRPNSEKGWLVGRGNNLEWKNYLQLVPKDRFYLAFISWPESFKVLKTAKNDASTIGFDVGWTPWPEGEDLIFSSKGKAAPLPQ